MKSVRNVTFQRFLFVLRGEESILLTFSYLFVSFLRLIKTDICAFCKCKNGMFFHFGSLVRRKQSVGAVLEFNGAISGRRGIIVNRH